MIASPSMYDPVQNPRDAEARRDVVLQRMLEQEFITEAQYREALAEDVPSEQQVDPPQPDSDQPYFTSWLTQQLVDRYNAPAVFSGGLKVRTTLDPELQAAAEQAIEGRLAGVGPSASLVAIENKTGEVKAMVGGTDFERAAVQPGHQRPSPAGLGLQAVHPGPRAAGRREPRRHLHLREEGARAPRTSRSR